MVHSSVRGPCGSELRVDFFVNSCSLLAGALVHICREHIYLERRWWTKAWVLPSESRQPEANVLC